MPRSMVEIIEINPNLSISSIDAILANWGLFLDEDTHINGYDISVIYDPDNNQLKISIELNPRPGEFIFLSLEDIKNSILSRICKKLS